jgi:hypothetical protein
MAKYTANFHPDIEKYGIEPHMVDGHEEEQALKEWGILGWMGYTYGDFIYRSIINDEIAAVVEEFGSDRDLIATYWSINEDTGESRTHRHKTKLSEIARSITESKYYELGGLADIDDMDKLQQKHAYFEDFGEGGVVSLRTVWEQEKFEAEERRKELEIYARGFASQKGLRMDTFEFIHAVEEEVKEVRSQRDRWNNPEVQMEEYAAHCYSGSGSESYFDDLNYVNGGYGTQIDDLEGILEFLRLECPLLMAKYEEKKLAGEWVEAGEEVVT